MNIGFIGMGNMGQMLVTALARSGILHPGDIFITSRNSEKLAQLAAAIPGLQTIRHSCEMPQLCQTIFLCIKPQDIRAVLQEIAPHITTDHLLVIITNTLDNAKLEDVVKARVAKVIPSVVQAVHAGVALLVFGDRCTIEDKALLHLLFRAISQPYAISEQQARIASDLTSCGPAFLSYIFYSLAQAAKQYQPDLPEETIRSMIQRTAQATLTLMERTGLTFSDIIDKVSTPGGVTADGIKVLTEKMNGVWEQVLETTIVKEEIKKRNVLWPE